MHPPLDRPHPDCQDVIKALKECHRHTFKKFTGGCNRQKNELDTCFVQEKERALKEMNKDWLEKKRVEDEALKWAFGRTETFEEYLARDKGYQRELAKKSRQQQQQP
ncbi:hypothetical protein ACA910_021282 [Epithemia clementina (nom. ined.)]